MKRKSLDSSCLTSAGYDPQGHVLEIEFNPDRVYQYLDVPAGVFQGLLDADSHGTYFNEEIKHRYPFRMIRKPPNF
jgi:hypothetical protein